MTTGCRLKVADFKSDHERATIRINEKGSRRRTIGLHFAAAEAIGEYIEATGLTSDPLFRPRPGVNRRRPSDRPFFPTAMYLLVQRYLEKLPGAVRTDEQGQRHCVYSPRSLPTTTATLLLDAGVDIPQSAGTAGPPARDHHPDS